MSQLGLMLQESVRRDREARTILGLLREQMDGVDRVGVRRRSLKERLGFKRIGCCGAAWGFKPSPISVSHDDEDDDEDDEEQEHLDPPNTTQLHVNSDLDSNDPPLSTSSGMNLAAALAAERQFRASDDGPGSNMDESATASTRIMPVTPLRVSLMRLLEETEVDSVTPLTATEKGSTGYDLVCCVCMVRKKGAAFIPCGHTYCRVCSRELWLNRGSCPLCNRLILEILDIF